MLVSLWVTHHHGDNFAHLYAFVGPGYFQERHWSYPGMAAALQSLMGSVQSQRLQHALSLTPSLLSVYFAVALRDVNDCKFHLTPPLVLGVVIINLWIDLGNKCLDPRKRCVECKVWGSLGKEN
jgi:hypothetical protein